MVPYHVLTLQTSGKMLWSWTCVAALCTLSSLVPISGEVKQKRSRSVWFKAREQHEGLGLSNVELKQIYQLNKLNNFHEHLDPIMIPRVVGTPGHATVRKHLIDTMKALGWTIEENSFTDTTPIGDKTFTNVIATLDPDAPRHLVLACHYDSKIDREREFIGATDSAVPCAMMLQLATVLRDSLNRHRQSCVKKKKKKKSKWKCNKKCRKKCSRREARKFWKKQNKRVDACDGNLGNCAHKLEECCSKACACITTPKHNLKYFGKLRCCTKYKTEKNYTLTFVPFVQSDLTLQFIFFDGEEAFHRWSKTDSLYGSRHLANKLGKTAYPQKNVDRTTHLNRMDLFVLLDLIGTEDVQFFNYFKNTEPWYARMVSYERRLNSLGDVTKRKFMFQPRERLNPGIEDDHIPFLDKGVPIVHLIPVPFPTVWHKSSDNGSALHYPTIENLNVIMQAFVADYLHLYL